MPRLFCRKGLRLGHPRASTVATLALRLFVVWMYGNRGKQPRGPVKVQKTKLEKNPAQIKSKERVAAHGEVFTADREVNAMLDLVKQETERIDSRFLEPACGTGNFLVKILERKLDVVKKKYRRSPLDFERNSILALSSIYGVDILADNAKTCRDRLFKIWNKAYRSVCKSDLKEDTQKSAQFILERNIVCGNALSLMKVDENGNDTDSPIVFSEWAFVRGNTMQRKDYTFADLMRIGEGSELAMPSDEGNFLTQYTSDYRRLWQDDKQA